MLECGKTWAGGALGFPYFNINYKEFIGDCRRRNLSTESNCGTARHRYETIFQIGYFSCMYEK